MTNAPLNPWYREPWPWILMAGPAVAVLGGIVTLALAVGSFDGLVAEDYYKQGLAVNQRLARARQAEALGIAGTAAIDSAGGGAVRVKLQGSAGALQKTLTLTLSHPTRAGLDQQTSLIAVGDGEYAGRIEALAAGRWHVIVEDRAGQWRIRGELQIPQQRSIELRGGQ